MSDIIIIENFMWEAYEIIWRTEIQKKASKSKNQAFPEFDDIVKRYTLNLYLIDRFKRDPGFKQYLIREIETDMEIRLNVINNIDHVKNYLCGDSVSWFGPSDAPNIEIEPYNFSNTKSSIFFEKHLEIAKSKSIFYDKKIKIDFFEKRLEIAKSKKNTDEIEALEALIYETETENTKSYDPFYKNELFKDKPSLLTSKSKKYSTNSINCFNLYNREKIPPQLKSPLKSPLNLLPELNLDFMNYLLKMHHPQQFQKEKNEDFTGNELKFVWDCFYLYVIYWFEKKDENQKLSILNREYEFSLGKSEILNFLECYDRSFLIDYSYSLQKSEYEIEAMELFEILFSEEYIKYDSDEEKIISVFFLDECYRSVGQYDKLVQKYDSALHLIKKLENQINQTQVKRKNNSYNEFLNFQVLDSSKITYLKVLCLKNMAEIYDCIDEKRKRDECFKQAIQISDNLQDRRTKFFCYQIISDGYCYTNNYDNFMFFLEKTNSSTPKIRTEEIRYFEKVIKKDLERHQKIPESEKSDLFRD